MPGNKKTSNYHAGCRKKQNKKRQATSPLNDNGSADLNSSENSNNKREQRKAKLKRHKQECTLVNTQPSGTGFSFDRYYQTMAFQSQQPGFGSMSQPSFIQTSPSAQFNGAFGFQPSPPPPLGPQNCSMT